MTRTACRLLVILTGVVLADSLSAQDPEPGVVSWSAPLYWSRGEAAGFPTEPAEEGALRVMALASVPTSPLPFIGITPCRIVETRDANRPPGCGG